MKKQRSSNYELLRIFAMLMIIFFHIMLHWTKAQITNEELQSQFNNGLFNHPIFYKKLLIVYASMPLGLVGNGLFMMISGYFLSSKENIDLIKTSKKILYQLAYATIILVLASFFFYIFLSNKYKGFYSLVKLTNFNSTSWWFIGYYYIIIVFAAIFLNKYMIKANQQKVLLLILVIFSVVEIGWTGGLLDSLCDGLRTTGIGVFFYMLGGYIKKYNPFKKIKIYVLFMIIILSFLIYFISSYNDVMNSIQTYVKSGSEDTFIQPIYLTTNFDILVVILTICIFEIFNRINIPNSRIINYLGASTFMIYLFHENTFFQSLYSQTDCISLLYNHPVLFIILIIKWIFLAFCIGLFAYISFNLGVILIRRISRTNETT